MKKSGTIDNIRWTVGGLVDLHHSGLLSAGECSLRQLTGRQMPGGKGIVDLLLGKHDVMHAFERRAVQLGCLHPSTTEILKKWSRSHVEFRKDVGQNVGDKDLTWLAALPLGDQKYLELVQD